MKTKGEKIKGRKARFWHADPRCHWCKRVTILPPRIIPVGYRPPDNLATIDHLRSRWDERRQEPNPEYDERTVLACLKCNNERERSEIATAGISEIQRRCGTQSADRGKLLRVIKAQARAISELKRAMSDLGFGALATSIKVRVDPSDARVDTKPNTPKLQDERTVTP